MLIKDQFYCNYIIIDLTLKLFESHFISFIYKSWNEILVHGLITQSLLFLN